MTTILAEPETREVLDEELQTTNDSNNATHIVMVPPGEDDETPTAYVLRARIEGFAIVALCGYTWIPFRDPKSLPVCSKCLDIYHQPGDHRDERDELPES